ncbi:MASE1 domain-containing protein [Sphaerospermopsis aphanizomenoides BCCUSP55]|uniref:MASE1 domain-containing protein n=1 Tax=Sphaerospermopsis aphanizomenoides TaxID=459663 RepID=UPI00190749AE|nr:MASE1 domain-containing protein [Sphaerospermopsis aphanizomenoides]MBK1990810.1 MASE1 domain-containing protein [Sphaerospermopsis aphanizomenoides BCCUSP55]
MSYNLRCTFIRLGLMAVLAFVYYQTAQFSRILAFTPQNVTPVWPPDGFATAAILIFGYWIWPGVFLGSFLANIGAFIDKNNLFTQICSLLQVLAIASGTTLGTLLGSFLLRKSIGDISPLKRLSDLIKFLIFTGMLGPVVNATVGVTALTLGGKIPNIQYIPVWLTWWVSNVAGILIFTPTLLNWEEFIKNNFITRWKKHRKLVILPLNVGQIIEALLLISMVIWIGKNAFWDSFFIEYMLIPCLAWSAFRFGNLGSTNLIVIISAIAILGTVRGLGAFARSSLNESLMLLQCFIGIIVLKTLILNAVLSEKQQALLILKKSQRKLLEQSSELQQTAAILEQQKEQLTWQNLELASAKQAAVAANHAKSEFLTNMSHELRTPLNGILGIAQVFQDLPKLTNQEKEDIAIIEKSGLHLLTLINDILDISKIEAGKMELEYQKFNFHDFLQGIVEIYRNSLTKKDINFIYNFASDLPRIVKSDEKRLRQILLNLLGNAIKFTVTGEVKFSVNVVSKETKNESFSVTKVKFEIVDTGIGIPAEKLSRIFLAFEQVGETQLKAQGTGLGLAISQNIARMMGSNITVISEVGKGSIFSFELDLETVLNYPEKFSSTLNSDTNVSEKIPLHILVAEDNIVNQKVAEKLFQRLGYKVDIAVNGYEVLNCLQQEFYDVIFMDVQMPELDGIEATKEIYHIWGENRPYIIAMTANAMEGDRENCLAAGMDDYISKPVKLEALFQAIQLMQERRFYN